MTSLVEELLQAQLSNADPSDEDTWMHRWRWLIEQHDKAKDAEIERLRAALQRIVKFAEGNGMQDWQMTKIARNALNLEQDARK